MRLFQHTRGNAIHNSCLSIFIGLVVGSMSFSNAFCVASDKESNKKTESKKTATKDDVAGQAKKEKVEASKADQSKNETKTETSKPDQPKKEQNNKIKALGTITSVKYKNGKKITCGEMCNQFLDQFEKMSGSTTTDANKQEIQKIFSDQTISSNMMIASIVLDSLHNAMISDTEYMNSEDTKNILDNIAINQKKNILLSAFIMEKVGPSDIKVNSSGTYKVFDSKECKYSDALSRLKDEYVQHCKSQNNTRKKLSYIIFAIDKNNNKDSDRFKKFCEPFVESNKKKGFLYSITGIFKGNNKDKVRAKTIDDVKEYAKQYKQQNPGLLIEDSLYLDEASNKAAILYNTILDVFNNKLNKSCGVAIAEISLDGQKADASKMMLCVCISDVLDEKMEEFDKLDNNNLSKFRSIVVSNLAKEFDKQYVFSIINDDKKKVSIDSFGGSNTLFASKDSLSKYSDEISINISDVKKLALDGNTKSLSEADAFKKLSGNVVVEYSVLGKTIQKTLKDVLTDAHLYKDDAMLKVIFSDEKKFFSTLIICAYKSVENDVTKKLFEASKDYNNAKNNENIKSFAQNSLVSYYIGKLENKLRSTVMKNASDEFGPLDKKENLDKKVLTGIGLRAVVIDNSERKNITPVEYVNEKDKNISESLSNDKSLSVVNVDSRNVTVYKGSSGISGFEVANASKKDIGEKLWLELIGSGNPPKIYGKTVDLNGEICSLVLSNESEFAGSRLAFYIEKYVEQTIGEVIVGRFEELRSEMITDLIYKFVADVNDIAIENIDKKIIMHHIGIKKMQK